MSTLIDLMRHGEPVGGRRYRGQVDDPLSEKGWAQMRAAVGEAAPWHHVVSSPLLRCREFAETLAA
ncbi:MAG: histidine phosphatase family protein, partial [Planctomycetota bacterium]